MDSPKNPENITRTSDVLTTIINKHGELLEVCYHRHTGRIISRKKNLNNNLREYGIVIGTDKYGNFWIAYQLSNFHKPVMDQLSDFASGFKTGFDPLPTCYSCIDVARRAVSAVINVGIRSKHTNRYGNFIISVIAKPDVSSLAVSIPDGIIIIGILSAFLRIIE